MNSKSKNFKLKNLAVIAMLTAMAYVSMITIRIIFPAAPFLTYDPKDVFIIIGGFLYGPLVVFPMSAALSLIEMQVSGTQLIGLVMNIASTCLFAFPAAFIYKLNRTVKGAAHGLAAGVIISASLMMPLNYLLTPLYTGASREAVLAMIMPILLPFNLFKCIYNAALTMLVYKRLSNLLRRLNLG